MNTCQIERNAVNGTRIHFLDNLRTFIIFLVVLGHAGGVYESSGAWASFWIVDDPSTNNQSGLIFLILDIFMMPALFFISGFLAPLSLEKKSGWAFVKSKFKRLMIPWMIAVLTLIPLYKIIFLSSRNLPQESWTTYFHWSHGIWSQNWLWFLPVLFMFDILYLFVSRMTLRIPNLSLKRSLLIAFLVGWLYSIGMDIFGLQGWTHTVVLDFQNERLLIYFIAFMLGAYCFRRKVFYSKPQSLVLYIIANTTASIPVMVYIVLLLYPWFKPEQYIVSKIPHKLILWFSYQLSLLCLIYVTIETFRRYFDKSGKIWNELSRNSYGVYIIHIIVMGAIAMLLLNTSIPSLLKHFVLTVATYIACIVFVYFYRRFVQSIKFNSKMENSTMKTVATAMLMIVLFSIAGCKKQEGSDNKNSPPHISLHVAALQGNLDAVQQHIDAHSDLNEKDAYGSTPLIVAVTFGETEIVRALIAAGADMEITNNEGATPLHIAAFLCRTEIVKMLLDNSADKNARNKFGRTPLETVSGPFEDVKGIYDNIAKGLKPLGLRLDYERIRKSRPMIAQMLG